MWTYQDVMDGLCSVDDVGTPKPADPAPVIHPLIEGIDLDHPDADRTILRRLYHKDPQAFLDAYGTAGINKLMDIAAKETNPQPYPDVADMKSWTKVAADVAKEVLKADPSTIATPAIMLTLLHESGGSLAALGESLRGRGLTNPSATR